MRANTVRRIVHHVVNLLAIFKCISAAADLGFADDDDLTSFVTRPEIRVAKLNITHRANSGVTPGYWFMAPYVTVDQRPIPRNYYQSCSVGPVIYDNDGELIWSGACLFQNQNAFDFRAFKDEHGADRLAMISDGYNNEFRHRSYIIGNDYTFATSRNITPSLLDFRFNMHEFQPVDHGRSMLYLTNEPKWADITQLGLDDVHTGWISDVGFREIDTATGDIIFEWQALDRKDRISIGECTVRVDEESILGPHGRFWNWFHPNSIDKSPQGDYLLSGRFTGTIYKISGTDGSILWRLGGKNSSFTQDFDFSGQHDARFLHPSLVGLEREEDGKEIISFFDNAKILQSGGIDTAPTAESSSGLIVELDSRRGTAKVLHRVVRPDGDLTALRGNFQILPNGNSVGGWSDNGYFSEHLPPSRLADGGGGGGGMVFEARFASKRFVSYRTYKFNFTGAPAEPPVVKAFGFSDRDDEDENAGVMVWYVSWNGATELRRWRFWAGNKDDGEEVEMVGETVKQGFETVFHSYGLRDVVFAEALSADGAVIGRTADSDVVHTSGDKPVEARSLQNGDAEQNRPWYKVEL